MFANPFTELIAYQSDWRVSGKEPSPQELMDFLNSLLWRMEEKSEEEWAEKDTDMAVFIFKMREEYQKTGRQEIPIPE